MAALHQQAGAAERERLLDLLEDHRLRQQVALAAIARGPVEGAEVAVGDADVRVVQVAVDDERDPARIGAAGPQLVGGAADRDEVARLEQGERLVVADPLAVQRLLQDLGRSGLHGRRCTPHHGHQTAAFAVTNRSSGTSSSSPTSRASSRKV